MDEQNTTYQLNCLFSPLLSLNESDKLIQEIKKEITDQGGSFIGGEVSATNLTKRKLAYLIDKYQEAFFFNIDFILPAQLANQLKKQIALKKDIIRCLVTVQKKEKPQTKKTEESFDFGMVDKVEPLLKKEAIPQEKTFIKEEIKEPEIKKTAPKEDDANKKFIKEKVKIEELDKKLEEILNA